MLNPNREITVRVSSTFFEFGFPEKVLNFLIDNFCDKSVITIPIFLTTLWDNIVINRYPCNGTK